jgi:hypothetical protein
MEQVSAFRVSSAIGYQSAAVDCHHVGSRARACQENREEVDVQWRDLGRNNASSAGSVGIFVFGPLMACRKAGLGFTRWVG